MSHSCRVTLTSTPISAPRINAGSVAPEANAALAALNATAHTVASAAGLSALVIELVQLRASQINGCSFCLRVHTRKALAAGESTDRLGVLPAWRESLYFDDTERAALDLVEAITLVADGRVPDAVYERVSTVLDADSIAAVVWLSIAINAYNRLIIAARLPVGP
jgi:AhpD family alkylhydroperoxidase